MAYIRKEPIAIHASTTSGTGFYSSNILNGYLLSVRYSSGSLSTGRTITIGRESSADVVMKFSAPSSGRNFYPRQSIHGTTGNVVSSSVLRCKIPFSDQRIKICVDACSSAGSLNGSISVYYGG